MDNRVSNIVLNQVPEFVRSDYPTFIAFLEAYYEYMDAQAIDVIKLRDLDESLEQFIKYFKSELAINMPESLQVNERFLLKNIKDLYLAKGSEASFKLLFKILYNKEVDVQYPGKQMLRASDGRWEQDVSIFVKVSRGTPDLIVGKEIEAVNVFRTIKLLVDKFEDVNVKIDNVSQVSPDTYEIFIDRKYYGVLSVGDRILYSDQFAGVIVSTIANVKVVSKGTGFRVGQLFEIKIGNAIGAIVKITKVDIDGGVLTAVLIKFGVNYISNFSFAIDSAYDYYSSQLTNDDILSESIVLGLNIVNHDTLRGYEERGTLNRADYLLTDAWDLTYCGELLAQFSDVTLSGILLAENSPASLHVTLGPVAKYPGYYITNDGFLDDAIYIQDSKYYQAFSYLLKVDERLETYRTAVRNMIHPSGTVLFGEFQIQNNFDIELDLQSLISSFGQLFIDQTFVTDAHPIFNINKVLADSITIDDWIALDGVTYLPKLDSGIVTDSGYIILNPYCETDYVTVSPIIYDTAPTELF